MIDINKAVVLTIPTYIPAINRMPEAYLSIPHTQRERNITIVFQSKFSATGFVVKINPYKVVLC